MMPADSLLDMSRRAFLLKIESPEKLHQLELNSPQIIGKDAEIWLNFIKRDIPDWQNKRHEPKDPKNWWKVYRKLKQEAQMNISQGEDKLRAALDNIKNEKEQNLAQMMSKNDIPRQQIGRRQRITYNYISGKTGSKGAHKMTLMEKIKKESRDGKMARMGRPMHELQKRATVVTKPPQQFVEDLKQKIAMSPPKKIQNLGQLGSPPGSNMGPKPRKPEIESSYNLTQDREARLRALKSGKQPTSPRQANSPSQTTGQPIRKPDGNSSRQSGILSSSFLEDIDDVDEKPNQFPKDTNDRARYSSPGRISSPQPGGLKRKQAPSLFMAPAKKVFRRPGIT